MFYVNFICWLLAISLLTCCIISCSFFFCRGSLELETPSVAEADNKMGASEDDEYARIMSRLEELEKEELSAEDNEENLEDEDEDEDANALESDGNEDELTKAAEGNGDEDELTKAAFHRKKDECYSHLDHGQRYSEFNGKEPIEKMSNKYKHQDLTNPFASTGLTEEPVTKGEISHGRIIQQDTKTLSPSINASAPFEKKSVQASKSKFDSSKAFTGSIVEHTQNLDRSSVGTNTTSLQSSGSQPWKPVSRFKMQRK
ncbi:hypothetical protein V6Z12_D01G019300 [Gossypium hirsutum]